MRRSERTLQRLFDWLFPFRGVLRDLQAARRDVEAARRDAQATAHTLELLIEALGRER